jgi:hypothetical protein
MTHTTASRHHRAVTVIRFSTILLGILWVSQVVFAQPDPGVLWTRTIGPTGHNDARAIQQTPDGGYLVAGFTGGTGGESGHASVIKLDANGEVVWRRAYSNEGNSWFFGLDVIPSGGFVVVGIIMTSNNNYEAWLIRAADNGDPIWSRTFGGPMNDQGYAVTATSDGGFAVAGLDASIAGGRYEAYLVKLNGTGDILWQHTWGVPAINVEARSVRECPDGGFIITGGSVSYGEWNSPFNMFVVRTNARGRTLWTRQYGGDGNDFASDAVCLPDGGFAVVGYTTPRGTDQRNMCMIRINERGRRIWKRTYGGPGDDAAFTVKRTMDGGFLLGGYTNSTGQGDQDLCLIKTNRAGVRQWRRTYGTLGWEYPWGNECVELTADGGYVLAGTTTPIEGGESSMFVVKTGPDQLQRISEPAGADFDTFVQDEIEPADEPVVSGSALPTNYPNPFNPTTMISYDVDKAGFVSLRVFNMLGQQVATVVNNSVEAGHHTVAFDGSALPSGLYIYRLERDGISSQNKMLLMK